MARFVVVGSPNHWHPLQIQQPRRLQAQSLSGLIQDTTAHSVAPLVVNLNSDVPTVSRPAQRTWQQAAAPPAAQRFCAREIRWCPGQGLQLSGRQPQEAQPSRQHALPRALQAGCP
jgi:hypothetical protein